MAILPVAVAVAVAVALVSTHKADNPACAWRGELGAGGGALHIPRCQVYIATISEF
jgi:hypothetical protein